MVTLLTACSYTEQTCLVGNGSWLFSHFIDFFSSMTSLPKTWITEGFSSQVPGSFCKLVRSLPIDWILNKDCRCVFTKIQLGICVPYIQNDWIFALRCQKQSEYLISLKCLNFSNFFCCFFCSCFPMASVQSRRGEANPGDKEWKL